MIWPAHCRRGEGVVDVAVDGQVYKNKVELLCLGMATSANQKIPGEGPRQSRGYGAYLGR